VTSSALLAGFRGGEMEPPEAAPAKEKPGDVLGPADHLPTIPRPPPPTDLLFLSNEGNFALECEAAVVLSSSRTERRRGTTTENPQRRANDEDAIGDNISAANGDDHWVRSSSDDAASAAAATLLLDRTVMHPQGGGQPTDTGLITSLDRPYFPYEFRVNQVTMERSTGVVTHAGQFVPSKVEQNEESLDRPGPGAAALWDSHDDDEANFRDGERVRVQVDADARRILSECHTAGHVVDAAMASCQIPLPSLKAYHYLDGSYVEYRGTIPASDRDAILRKLQDAFQLLLDQDMATEIRVVNVDEADQLCNQDGSAPVAMDVKPFVDPVTQNVRVVTVAGYSCPCGGTHVRSTAELKSNRWKITGVRCKKNVVRVKYGYEGAAPPASTTASGAGSGAE
jgi:Ser-tRNA(Ala) deacylase AlaX